MTDYTRGAGDGALIVTALYVGAFLLGWFLSGCTIGVDHKLPADRSVDVQVTVTTDACLFCLPKRCGRCETPDRVLCLGCEPACLGGRYLTCTATGPECSNDFPTGREKVPTVCVSVGDGGLPL